MKKNRWNSNSNNRKITMTFKSAKIHYQVNKWKYQLIVFRNLKIKIIPIFEDIEKIILRKKFSQFFDVAVIGFYNSAYVKNKDLKNIWGTQGHFSLSQDDFIKLLITGHLQSSDIDLYLREFK